MASAYIEVRGVRVSYGGETVLEIDELRLEGPGLYQVLGPNGAGKTTFLRVVTGLLKPERGEVVVNGVRVEGRPELAGRFIGYVPQYEHVDPGGFPATAYEVVASALLLRRPWPRLRLSRRDARRVEEVLEEVGLPRSAWYKRLRELSGGQLQRVLLARALVHDPPILLLDEPLSAVDPRGRAELAELIGGLGEEKLIVATSHDPVILLRYTRGVVLLNRRLVAAGRPEEVLRSEILRKVYGSAVLEIGVHPHICDSH